MLIDRRNLFMSRIRLAITPVVVAFAQRQVPAALAGSICSSLGRKAIQAGRSNICLHSEYNTFQWLSVSCLFVLNTECAEHGSVLRGP